MNKNIIFYSQHCPHSRKVIKIFNEEKLVHNLVRICIDSSNIKIPSFITCVPTVYLSKTKELLTNEKLEEWILKLREDKNSKTLTPFCMANSTFSENFSFLDGGDQVPNFNFSDYEAENQKINTPTINSSKKGVNKDYERLLEERQKETFSMGVQRI